MKAILPILSFAVLVMSGPAFADGAAAAPGCSVPVCDMTRALGRFQTQGSQDQSAALQRYITMANQSSDTAVLKNLNDFGAGAKTILVAAAADRVLVDTATQLSSVCVSRLARFSEVNAEALMGYFRLLRYEGDRFDILSFWTAKIKGFEERDSLRELTRFFSEAGKYTDSIEDDEYVVRLAKSSEQTASKKLARLQPFLEGIYSAQVRCEGKETCPESGIDRVVIMDTLVLDNIEVSLVATAGRISVYRFSNVTLLNGMTAIEGFGTTQAGAIAKLHLDFDQAAQSLSGYVESADFRLSIQAKQDPSVSLIALFDRQFSEHIENPISPDIFVAHKLVGTFAGKAVELKINIFPEDESTKREETLGGTMSFADIANYKLRFHAGRFFPKTGLLLLVANATGTGNMKVGLTIRPDDANPGRYVFKGFSFASESAGVSPVQFTLDTQGATPW